MTTRFFGGAPFMKETSLSFQAQVDEYLLRHRSILDILTKLQESTARVNRAIAKAVTTCGCISITATKQQFPNDVSLSDLRQYLQTHLDGKLCERCMEAVETEIGSELFYIAALCNILDLDLEAIRKKEHSRIKTLGIYNLK
jgi:NTP pyrophosphatase (non-canonical NTP hydrolase)